MNETLEQIEMLRKMAKSWAKDPKTLGIIDGICSRLRQAYDLEHALTVFAEGCCSEKLFLSRIKDLTHSCKMGMIYKVECPGCHKFYWTIKKDQSYCSKRCLKKAKRAEESMKRKVRSLT